MASANHTATSDEKSPSHVEPAIRWQVVDVHHQEITMLGAGYVVLFGVATPTRDNRLIVRNPDGYEITAPAGRVDPQALAQLLLRKLCAAWGGGADAAGGGRRPPSLRNQCAAMRIGKSSRSTSEFTDLRGFSRRSSAMMGYARPL